MKPKALLQCSGNSLAKAAPLSFRRARNLGVWPSHVAKVGILWLLVRFNSR